MLGRYGVLTGVVVLALSMMMVGCATEAPPSDPHAGHQHAAGDDHAHEPSVTPAGETSPGADDLSGEVVDGVREVSVEAFQYGFRPDPIVVKKGEKVKLIATSTDVAHGLGIADLGIDMALAPGEEAQAEFTPEKAGEFHIHCTVYCGSGHGDMHGMLKVVD